MATASPERLRIAGKLANTKRNDPSADTTELRRDLAAVKLADYIRAIVDAAPPLTDEQKDRLALLLRGGSSE